MNTEQLSDLRKMLGIIAQALVDVLDAIDGEPDEETADLSDDECAGDIEYSLGWSGGYDQRLLGAGCDDLEEQVEFEYCAAERGDLCWSETHGYGEDLEGAYDYETWNQCTAVIKLTALTK